MPKWGAVGLGGVILLVALAVIIQQSRMTGLQDDLDTLRSKMRRLEVRPESADREESSPATVGELKALQNELARVERKTDATLGGINPPPGAGSLTLIKEEDIQQLVDERLEAKLQERGEFGADTGDNNQNPDRKVPLEDLAADLNLAPQAKAEVSNISDQTKRQIFDLLRSPRVDGTNIADEILDAFTGGERDKIGAIFVKLFSERIPGTEDTYASGIGVIQDRARLNLRGVMGDATYEKFEGMNLKPENITTEFDPWAEYAAQR